MNRTMFFDKDRTMDNVQKHDICIRVFVVAGHPFDGRMRMSLVHKITTRKNEFVSKRKHNASQLQRSTGWCRFGKLFRLFWEPNETHKSFVCSKYRILVMIKKAGYETTTVLQVWLWHMYTPSTGFASHSSTDETLFLMKLNVRVCSVRQTQGCTPGVNRPQEDCEQMTLQIFKHTVTHRTGHCKGYLKVIDYQVLTTGARRYRICGNSRLWAWRRGDPSVCRRLQRNLKSEARWGHITC
jgi:hypothetical protein